MKYSILVQWSDEDRRYVVILPEFADVHMMPVADGATYEEAIERGRNALENIIEFMREDGRPLPAPHVFAA
jgi:predicted RNase H-like HicB family nuclease